METNTIKTPRVPPKTIRILDKDKVRCVGTVENKVFKKKIDDKKHIMRIYGSPGIQKEVFNLYDEFHTIEITTHQGTTYRINASDFLLHCEEKDFGHGKQLFVHKKYWDIETPQGKLI
jgi:hypothetical protein